MVEVICDTNFLIHLATNRIKNLDRISLEIGTLTFLVPNVVLSELEKLKDNPIKKNQSIRTLEYIKKFQNIKIDGIYADEEILNHIKNNKSFVATMDKEFKKKIKNLGSVVISFQNNNMVMES